jgi:hypothetical protein
MTSTPINVLMNGESIVQYFDSVSIKFIEGAFCNSIDLNVNSMDLWDRFDPIKYFGQLVLEVPIGNLTYKFMVEERNTNVSIPGVAFSVWGRSAQAFLDQPYSKIMSDIESEIEDDPTKYVWQKGDSNVTAIIGIIKNICCSYHVDVHWNVKNFTIYKGSFTASNTTPIAVISQFAGIIGAELVANADGSLTVQEYSVQEDVSIQEYNDMDHIVSLNDEIVYPIGYNCVMVNGYSNADSGSQSAYLTPVLQEDDLKGWEYGKRRTVRVYHYHSKGLGVISTCFNGSSGGLGHGIEQKSEWVVLIWGEGSTQYADRNGDSEVKGSGTTPIEIRKVTYSVNYTDFAVASLVNKTDDPNYGIALFFFTDYSNTATMNFDYYADSATDDDGNLIPDILLEIDEEEDAKSINAGNNGIVYGNTIISTYYLSFKIWGDWFPVTDYIYDSSLTELYPPNLSGYETIIEEITVTNGSGSVSKPLDELVTYRFPYPGTGGGLKTFKGQTRVQLSYYNKRYPISTIIITYRSRYTKGKALIPSSFVGTDAVEGKAFFVYLVKKPVGDEEVGEILSVSKTVSQPSTMNTETSKNIVLVIKDFATEVVIPGTSVYVDGNHKGVTNADGEIYLNNISIGDHIIKLVAQGYLDSDEDELANDTFTVSSST